MFFIHTVLINNNRTVKIYLERIIPEEGRRASGYGTATIDEIAQQFKSLYDPSDQSKATGYLAKIRNSLGADSPEFLAIKEYIQNNL